MKKLNFIYLLFLLITVHLSAQMPVIEVPNKNGEYKNNNTVKIDELYADVKIVGNIATTTTTITLKNNGNRILEGRVTFPLPEGVSVSGYALDINGKLREAVPVAKAKAKEVFESIERRRIDPGLIEKVEGNNFRTRVYPINPNQTRTVQITYNQLLENTSDEYVYHLLTSSKTEIPNFKLKLTVFDQLKVPQLKESPDGSFTFQRNGNNWTAEILKQNFTPKQNLTVNIPKKGLGFKVITQPASKNNHYFLANVDLQKNMKRKKQPKSIALVWDTSLSGMDRNHDKEFELLEAYFKWFNKVNVQVYELNNTFTKTQKFKISRGDWASLKSYLSNLTYDGGTDFETIQLVDEEEILFFSDGISSFGDVDKIWDRPVYTIVSTPKANYQNMIKLSSKGGAMLNLNERSPKDVVSNLLNDNLRFLGIEKNNDVSEVVSSTVTINDNGITISGILSKPLTDLTLKFGYGNIVDFTKKININTVKTQTKDWDIAQFWAQYKVANLERQFGDHDNEIENIAKQFGIVTHNMSLMVLESIDDYLRYDITPPAELRDEFNKITKENRSRLANSRNSIMNRAEKMIVDLKEWWKTDFKPKKVYPKTDKIREGEMPPPPPPVEEYAASDVVAEGVAGASNRMAVRGVASLQGRAAGVDDSISEKKKMSSKPSGNVRVVDVKSDQEYMKLFEGKSSEEIYALYLKNRATYKTTVSYYFDVAQLLWEDRKDLALKVLTSVADLDLENEEIYKLLAYQLKNKELYNKELWVTKRVLEWRPFDPQSYRDYALALEDNGKYQEALDNLYKIITQTYTEEIASRDNGIEEVVLMEMNQLITRRKNELNINDINPKLIADLPVNIRVVINWNKDHTDIDLWVTDPMGEECSYQHKRTAIGGRLSTDFTRGFGPEQFLLKKAMKGKYKIETNFFGENQVSVSGPTAIMAEVYIDYASGTQERKTIVFQKDKKEDGSQNKNRIFIAEFEF